AMNGVVMPCGRVDNAGQYQSEIGFTLLPRQPEKLLQFFDSRRGIVKPLFIRYRAEIEVARIPKEIDHVNEPSIFPIAGIEAVTRLERSRDLRRVAQAQHDSGGQFELAENLMPYRH